MVDKFLTLEFPMQIFWGIAMVTSVFFVIQTIMAFMGLDADTDDGSGFESVEMEGLTGYFSFRNLINFLLGYGWGGILLQGAIPNMILLELAAVGVGLLFVMVFVILLRQVMKLSTDKTFHMNEAVGLIADTYLRIPGEKKGVGKVLVSVRGSVHEIDAMTEGAEIPTGTKVRITKVLSPELLEVEKI